MGESTLNAPECGTPPSSCRGDTTTGASRLDRIYIRPTLQRKKRRVETIVAALRDHLAILMRMKSGDPILTCGREFWRMDTTLLRETDFRQLLQDTWKYWRTQRKYYPTMFMWWEHYVKCMLRKHFTWEGTDRRRDRRVMENSYYEAINATLRAQSDYDTTTIMLKRLKAKFYRLHHEKQRRLFINTRVHDRLDDESPTLYHFIRARKRHVSWLIQTLPDSNGVVYTRPKWAHTI
jgi:hypothetical protein